MDTSITSNIIASNTINYDNNNEIVSSEENSFDNLDTQEEDYYVPKIEDIPYEKLLVNIQKFMVVLNLFKRKILKHELQIVISPLDIMLVTKLINGCEYIIKHYTEFSKVYLTLFANRGLSSCDCMMDIIDEIDPMSNYESLQIEFDMFRGYNFPRLCLNLYNF